MPSGGVCLSGSWAGEGGSHGNPDSPGSWRWDSACCCAAGAGEAARSQIPREACVPAGLGLASQAGRGWCAPGGQRGLGHAYARAHACAWLGREGDERSGGVEGAVLGDRHLLGFAGCCGVEKKPGTKPWLAWRRRWGHSGHMPGTLGPEQAGQRWLGGSVGLCQLWGPCVRTLGTLCHPRTLCQP